MGIPVLLVQLPLGGWRDDGVDAKWIWGPLVCAIVLCWCCSPRARPRGSDISTGYTVARDIRKPAGGVSRQPPCDAVRLREPAFTTEDSTFCIWRRSTDAQWSCGPVQFPLVRDPDGSEALLSILAGQLQHYVEFARDYYEVEIAPADVAAVYRHDPLTNALSAA